MSEADGEYKYDQEEEYNYDGDADTAYDVAPSAPSPQATTNSLKSSTDSSATNITLTDSSKSEESVSEAREGSQRNETADGTKRPGREIERSQRRDIPGDRSKQMPAPAKPVVPPGPRHAGTVKWYSTQKRFGFITSPGLQEDVFVHHSDFTSPEIEALGEGQPIEFSVRREANTNRLRAQAVTGPNTTPLTPPHMSRANPEYLRRLQQNPSLRLGTVKWFKNDYGFVIPEDKSADVFIHASALVVGPGSGPIQPREGEEVEYQARPDDRHPTQMRASQVTRPGGLAFSTVPGAPAPTMGGHSMNISGPQNTRNPHSGAPSHGVVGGTQSTAGGGRVFDRAEGSRGTVDPLLRIGRIKMFTQGKFGFVEGQDGIEYYLHSHQVIRAGFTEMERGTIIEFIVDVVDGNNRAIGVTLPGGVLGPLAQGLRVINSRLAPGEPPLYATGPPLSGAKPTHIRPQMPPSSSSTDPSAHGSHAHIHAHSHSYTHPGQKTHGAPTAPGVHPTPTAPPATAPAYAYYYPSPAPGAPTPAVPYAGYPPATAYPAPGYPAYGAVPATHPPGAPTTAPPGAPATYAYAVPHTGAYPHAYYPTPATAAPATGVPTATHPPSSAPHQSAQHNDIGSRKRKAEDSIDANKPLKVSRHGNAGPSSSTNPSHPQSHSSTVPSTHTHTHTHTHTRGSHPGANKPPTASPSSAHPTGHPTGHAAAHPTPGAATYYSYPPGYPTATTATPAPTGVATTHPAGVYDPYAYNPYAYSAYYPPQ